MNSNFGYLRRTQRWTPFAEISGPNQGSVVPGTFEVDPYLPVLRTDTDEYHPQGGVVIPAGRFVAIGSAAAVHSSGYQQAITSSGHPTLTLHDGKNTKPAGMATSDIYKRAGDYMQDSFNPTFRKAFLAEVPYIVSVNAANGALKSGDRVTGYWGSSTSTSAVPMYHRGKPVKFLPKAIYQVTDTAAAAHDLDAAVYPGIVPEVIVAYNGSGAVVPSLTAAYAYASGVWTVTFSGTNATTVTTVVYTMGHNADQIAGNVIAIRNLVDVQAEDNLFKFVEDGAYFDIPPAMQQRATTQVALTDPEDPGTGETPSTVVSGRQYRVAHYPMSIHHPVTVYVQGTVVDDEGNSTTYSSSSWYQLPVSMMRSSKGYFFGQYHTVNWSTGIIELGVNITSVTQIRVTYSYLTDPREGAVLWGQGQMNLTDGANLEAGAQISATTVVPTNTRGIPAFLNATDVVGSLRVWVD